MQLNIRSISSKLIFGGVIAVMAPLLVVGFLSFSKSKTALMTISENQVQGIASDLARMTQNTLTIEMNRAATMASQKRVIELAMAVKASGIDENEDRAKDVYEALKRQFAMMGENYQGIFITDASGMIYTGVLEGGSVYNRIDLSGNPSFRKAKDSGRVNISEMIISKATGKPATSAFAPIKSDRGEFLGVFGTVIKAQYFTDLISQRKIGETGYALPLWMGSRAS